MEFDDRRHAEESQRSSRGDRSRNRPHTDERSLSDLMQALSRETRAMVRLQIGLAQAEAREKAAELNAELRQKGARLREELRGKASEANAEFREKASRASDEIKAKASDAGREMKAKGTEAGRHAAVMGAGGATAFIGGITLVLGIALLLGTLMPDWLAFLITGLVVVLVGYSVLRSALSRLQRIDFRPSTDFRLNTDLKPSTDFRLDTDLSLDTDFSLPRTARSLQEDKQWIQKEAKELKARTTPSEKREATT